LRLLKWKQKANIKSAKTRTAAACGALGHIGLKDLVVEVNRAIFVLNI
jgi:hypothetical protein